LSISLSACIEPFSSRWHLAINSRKSRRQYDLCRPIPPDILLKLRSACADFRPFPSVRVSLVTESSEGVFKGAVGPYGKVKDAPAFVAFIGNMADPHVQEKVGYTGEGIVLEATALGLATCWVGVFFRAETVAPLVGLEPDERVLAVTPIGYAQTNKTLEEKLMTGFVQARQRKHLSSLTAGMEEEQWPRWIKASLEAARLAPSAVNRQPWSFFIEPGRITVSVRTGGPDFGISKRLDCGIAMLHIEVGALACGAKGEWHFLKAPQVARFSALA